MNLRAFLLIGSIVLNVALAVAFVLRPALAPPALREFFSRGSAPAESEPVQRARERQAAATRAAADTKRAAETQARLWSALASADLHALIARLREQFREPPARSIECV